MANWRRPRVYFNSEDKKQKNCTESMTRNISGICFCYDINHRAWSSLVFVDGLRRGDDENVAALFLALQ